MTRKLRSPRAEWLRHPLIPEESSMMENEEGNNTPTAFLVDLVSNRKIPVATPRCRVGRDDLNDIVISGDQSISRFHFIISYENDEFTVQDAKSRHGTFLNGNQITTPENIKDGDVLKVGVSLFWFVVEGVQVPGSEPVSPPTVSAISGERSDGVGITVKSHSTVSSDLSSPMTETSIHLKALEDPNSKKETQEMAKIDPKVLDKLEEAANSIQIEPKPEGPKASLASLLQPLATEVVQSNEDAVKAKIAAQDKELLSDLEGSESEPAAEQVNETAAALTTEPTSDDSAGATVAAESEPSTSSFEPQTDDAESDDELKTPPAKILNKPSDTVTLEALQPAGLASSLKSPLPEDGASLSNNSESKAKSTNSYSSGPDAGIIDTSSETTSFEPEDKVSSPKHGLGNLLNNHVEEHSAESLQSEPALEPETKLEATVAEAQPEFAAAEKATELVALEEYNEEASDSVQAEPTVSTAESSSASAEIMKESGSNGSGLSGSLKLDDAISQRAGATNVPDWTKRYFSDEIAKLNTELDELNEQVKLAQQKIRDVETRVALTKGVRNTLLTTTGDELVEACGKVLSLIGWKVTIAADDKHELRLEVDDKQVCIARVIWTTTQAERSHLGQLSISQTRYWCEKGTEPKGILIVSKISDQPPTGVGSSTEEAELADYAAKKNVCLMTTMQLLSLYKEVALDEAKPDSLRSAIIAANGWLAGHDLEPGSSESVEKDETSSNQSNKLSSLLSA